MDLREIPGFPNYLVTKDGRVWSIRSKKWLKPWITDGYLLLRLCLQGSAKTYKIHRLVLEAYVGPCPEGMECRHLDGDRVNNHLDNLKWGTHVENMQDAVQHNTHYLTGKFGEKNPASKLTDRERRLIYCSYRAMGCTQQELADQFGVTPSCISYIVNNKHCWGL